MKRTIAGIILFLAQISLALFYNQTVDLKYIAALAVVTFIYILYKYFTRQYGDSEV